MSAVEDVPALETTIEVPTSGRDANKHEKKIRKSLAKLGLELIPDVARVTMRRGRGVTFTIADADVYKAPSSHTYIIFGDAQVEDPNATLREQAAALANVPAAVSATAEEPEEEEEGDVDATGLAEDEIETVIAQASCSRAKAIRCLKSEGTVVDAIMKAME